MTIFVGHGEDENTISSPKSLYELNGYEGEGTQPLHRHEFDENSTIGVVAAPMKDFTNNEIERLRKWLNNEGTNWAAT